MGSAKWEGVFDYGDTTSPENLPDALSQLRDHKTALDAASIVAETDLTGKITYVNDKFCQVSKYSRDELIGKDHRIINSGYHSKTFFKELWATISSGKTWHGVIRNKAKDGSFYWVSTVVVPFHDLGGRIYKYVAIRHEITEEKELQYQLAIKSELAEKALNSASLKGRFISELSHEIKGALNCIIGFSELLSMSAIDAGQKIYVEKIKKSSGYILGLTNDVLDASRLEASKVVLDESPLKLKECLSSLVEMVGATAKSKGLRLETEFSEGLPGIVLADQYRLSQILLNFLNNAIKYTGAGKVILRSELLQRDYELNRVHLCISVSDTGRGISSEDQKKLFVEFEQCRPGDVNSGTGLGLAICKRLSELMDGQIEVASSPGSGTTFSLKIWVKLGATQ